MGSGKRGAVVLDNVNITHITEVMMAMSSRVMITMMDYTKITQEQEKEAEREREAREMKEQSCKKKTTGVLLQDRKKTYKITKKNHFQN